jgi:tRNA A-37 threonylcarbamoyl transferase component Bud32
LDNSKKQEKKRTDFETRLVAKYTEVGKNNPSLKNSCLTQSTLSFASIKSASASEDEETKETAEKLAAFIEVDDMVAKP